MISPAELADVRINSSQHESSLPAPPQLLIIIIVSCLLAGMAAAAPAHHLNELINLIVCKYSSHKCCYKCIRGNSAAMQLNDVISINVRVLCMGAQEGEECQQVE